MKRVIVVIGHPCQKAPAVRVVSEISVADGNEVREAKILRKEKAAALRDFGLQELKDKFGMKFSPSDFYYAVFTNKEDISPAFASDNYFWRQDKSLLEWQENPNAAFWYDQGYADVRDGTDNRPNHVKNLLPYKQGIEAYKKEISNASD